MMLKKIEYIVSFILIISLTGCYTIVSQPENDNSEVYAEPVYIPVPVPVPVPLPAPDPYPAPPSHYPPPRVPENPPTKTRKPELRNSGNGGVRDNLRNSGDRDISGRRHGR